MSGPLPTQIELTDRQREILERLARRETSPQRLVRRCRIILIAAEGRRSARIGQELNIERVTARTWRERWAEAEPGLRLAEEEGLGDKGLRELIEQVLTDRPRPGRPATFEPEQIAQIMAVACEGPQESGRAVTHWAPRELAEEVIKRGFVTSIPP